MAYAVKASLQLKAEGDAGRFSGYASTYNLDLQNDKIEPGAFAQSITDKKGKVPIFFNHEDWIGFSTSLAEDGKGLAMTAELALGNTISDNAYALLQKAAQLDFRVGMSIGFTAQDWDWDGNIRTLKEINLYEVSITPFPAQPKAFVTDLKSWRNFEKYLRDAEHFSRADTKRIMSAFAACNQSSCGMPDDTHLPLSRRLLAALSAEGAE
jgi:HK97 family phage prohead protease